MRALAAIVIGLTMAGAACSTATAPGPRILDVRGIWIGDWEYEPASAGRGVFTMTLEQTGEQVRGAVQLTGLDRTSPTPVSGMVKGDEIHLAGIASSGILKVRANEMTGTLQGSRPAKVIARRQAD